MIGFEISLLLDLLICSKLEYIS